MRKLLFLILAFVCAAVCAREDDARGTRRIVGNSCFNFPNPGTLGAANPTAFGALTIDAAGEMGAFIGYVINSDRGSHVCSTSCTIGWRPGGITWASANSAIVVSLQDVSAAAGAPIQPDETADVSNTLVQGTDALTGSTWTNTTMDTGTKTVAHGDMIAAVWNMTVRNGADSITISAMNGSVQSHLPASSAKTGGTWAGVTLLPNVIITYDDGATGVLAGGFAASATTGATYNSGTASVDEKAILFTAPIDGTIDGAWANWFPAASGDAELILYSDPLGSTPVAQRTIVLDANQAASNAALRFDERMWSSPYPIKRGSKYAISIRPTSANNVTVAGFTASTNAILGAFWAGTGSMLATRADNAGAFTADTNDVPLIGARICGIQSPP